MKYGYWWYLPPISVITVQAHLVQKTNHLNDSTIHHRCDKVDVDHSFITVQSPPHRNSFPLLSARPRRPLPCDPLVTSRMAFSTLMIPLLTYALRTWTRREGNPIVSSYRSLANSKYWTCIRNPTLDHRSGSVTTVSVTIGMSVFPCSSAYKP